MNQSEILKEFLAGSNLMQLATLGEAGPWICSVYFVADYQNCLYWTSARVRRHSKEILSNAKAAANIVVDSERKQAIQMTGEAYEVPLDDVERVDRLYGSRFGDKPSRLQEVLENNPDGRAYWVLRPATICLWDEVNFPDTPKQVVGNEVSHD